MSGGGFVQQALVNALLLPVAGLEMRAEHTEIDQRKFAPDQLWQQRRETFAVDCRQCLTHRTENRRLHQRQRH